MKQFLVFAAANYYPRGGWADYQAAFNIQEDAEDYANHLVSSARFEPYDWAQVIDIEVLQSCYTAKRTDNE